jgi:hypothetical protein
MNHNTYNDLMSKNPSVKKGDTCYLVSIYQGTGYINGEIQCREVTIQSLGKKHGTAIGNDGHFTTHRIYVCSQIIVKTKEECLAIAETYKEEFLENAREVIHETLDRMDNWKKRVGHKASQVVLDKHEKEVEALQNHKFSYANVLFYG